MNFSALTYNPYKVEIRKIPDINSYNQHFAGSKQGVPPAISTISTKYIAPYDKKEKQFNIPYILGTIGSSLEVASGLFLIAGAHQKFENVKNNKHLAKVLHPMDKVLSFLQNNFKSWHDSIEKFKNKNQVVRVGELLLGLGCAVAVPMEMSAAKKSDQPGMMASSALWAAMALPIMIGLSTRVKGFYSLAYAPSFAAFANEIHNDFRLDKGEKARKQKIELTKPWQFAKFCAVDITNAAKTSVHTIGKTAVQGWNWFIGNTDKTPDIFSTKPSKESMSLASTLVILGALPRIILGKRLDPIYKNVNGEVVKQEKLLEKFSGYINGAGMIFDTLGMMSMANTKDDARKPALLLGGPMRILGDFRPGNDKLYGLRTIGGASCMYYWAGIDKEKQEKESLKRQNHSAVSLRTEQSTQN